MYPVVDSGLTWYPCMRERRALDVVECQSTCSVSSKKHSTVEEQSVCLTIASFFDVLIVKRKARELSEHVGFPQARAVLIAGAIAEAANNIVKFANRGRVLIREVAAQGRRGIEITVQDNGPRNSDSAKAAHPGFTTTLKDVGQGLADGQRFVDGTAMQSDRNEGTTITMVEWLR